MHVEDVHSSPITKKVLSERHSVVQEEDHLSSYNIEEIFGALSFHLNRKEVSRKRVRKVKQNDRTLEEMQEDEVLFEKIDEYPMIVAIALATITQDTTHDISILNENILEAES